MSAALLSPAALDQAAVRLVDEAMVGERWRGIIDGWQRTAPADPASRKLVSKTVDELVTEALRGVPEHGTRPPIDVRLPGRLARALPDWAHRRRTDITIGPEVQLYVAAELLRGWGWQARPHHLRDLRGRRCICGAICAAVDLGFGMPETAHQAAAYILAELRKRNWPHLIGDWNQQPGRTAQQAIDLTLAAYTTAAAARH